MRLLDSDRQVNKLFKALDSKSIEHDVFIRQQHNSTHLPLVILLSKTRAKHQICLNKTKEREVRDLNAIYVSSPIQTTYISFEKIRKNSARLRCPPLAGTAWSPSPLFHQAVEDRG